ncbi:MAG: GNAT family N-acetyltransferase [Dehalococcoidia bacterium]|nr:GNAT family N-acetyltransferase [Dehalococcoidia bacterium]
MINIRKATLQDLEAITAIYNDAIINTVATFDTEPKSSKEQLTWFNDHHDKYKILVAEIEGKVVGWASLSKWSDRCAYADTAECSLYIEKAHRSRGIGRKLVAGLMDQARMSGLHTLIVRIAEGNNASIHICESYGFRHIGIMKEVGRKFGKLQDVHLMQIIFK